MILINQLSLPILYSEQDIKKAISKTLNIASEKILSYKIKKLSIDARKKPNIKYVASIAVCLDAKLESKFANLKYDEKEYRLQYVSKQTDKKTVVVGFGPSGMFAALALVKMGIKPIVIEQGNKVDQRELDVQDFWNNKKLNRYSNVQFGEGGAGTFSDGKLNTNLNNDYCKVVINELCSFGAPEEISYINKPHIGSDKLKAIVKNIREYIISQGGTFMFNTKLIDIQTKNNELSAIVIENVLTQEKSTLKVDNLLLCVGHSARDTFEMLNRRNVELQQKPFAMGVRIEQKQKDINQSQYGSEYVEGLPNADYKLVQHLDNGRSIFTFCMCPGGQVVASSSDEGEIVTNGMSLFARDQENANSAVLINIVPEDYGSDHPLAGIYYQAKYEKLAFDLGGKNYNAPAQSVGSFLGTGGKTNINYSYKPDVTFCDISKCLPSIVSQSLKIGIPLLNKKLSNFAKDENLLIAIESRTSCPLTIVRDQTGQSNIKGLYPVGEGAGYAGGIMSSAQDGIKAAENVYNNI